MYNKFLLVSVMLVLTTLSEADSWKKPGCHRIGDVFTVLFLLNVEKLLL